jgi:hypothetical protein
MWLYLKKVQPNFIKCTLCWEILQIFIISKKTKSPNIKKHHAITNLRKARRRERNVERDVERDPHVERDVERDPNVERDPRRQSESGLHHVTSRTYGREERRIN